MKHIKLYEGWLDSLSKKLGLNNKRPTVDMTPYRIMYKDTEYQKIEGYFKYHRNFNRENFGDIDKAEEQLIRCMGTDKIVVITPRGHFINEVLERIYSNKHNFVNFSDSNNNPEVLGEGRDLWWYMHQFYLFYFTDSKICYTSYYNDSRDVFVTEEFFDKWLYSKESIKNLNDQVGECLKYKFYKNPPEAVATLCHNDLDLISEKVIPHMHPEDAEKLANYLDLSYDEIKSIGAAKDFGLI